MAETAKQPNSGNLSEKRRHKGGSLLERIDSPADLRALSEEQLPEVCADIRRFLINALAKNPGHFASSMGAVELTVALHYVFNTPYDRIVWDVGHQAYGHKLLTGRRDRFETNRKLGGLSGFPNPDESEYDTFTAGHASNSISAALGMAVATEMNGDSPRRKVVAVIGDASIGGGLAFEGLNNAANTPNNLLIILNDNNMSIDDNVGSLHSYLAHITTSKGYNDFRNSTFQALKKLGLVNDSHRGPIMRFNNSLKSLLSREQNIFEGLNVRYFGPIDGHDVGNIVKVLRDIKDMTGPKILHIKTVKGKGFEAAEQNPSVWHAPGKFDPETGEQICADKGCKCPPKFQDVFGKTLLELARENRSIVGITAAMLSGTSMSVLKDNMPERVFDVGISEEHAVTFAGGLAKDGMRPFVAIYSSFLQRAYDQIIHDVAIPRLPVTFCIDRAGLVGEDGVTHHGAFDIAYLRTVPGMTIAAPRDEMTLRNLMFTAQATDCGPMAIRYPRGCGSNVAWHYDFKLMEIGKGERLREGRDVAVISTGTICSEVIRAIGMLEGKGISVAHYDMTFVKPLDMVIIDEVVGLGCPVITVEDGTVVGGLGSAIADVFAEKRHYVAFRKIGIPDAFVTQGSVAQLREVCCMDARSIAGAIEALAMEKNANKDFITTVG